MKKLDFWVVVMIAAASLCLASCSKSIQNFSDQNTNETTAKTEVVEQPASGAQTQDKADNVDQKVAETKPVEVQIPQAPANGEGAKSAEGPDQNRVRAKDTKYFDIELYIDAELPQIESEVVGDFGSAHWKDFEEKYEAPLLSIDAGKDIMSEMEKTLDLVCDPQSKTQTMPSGVVFQAVNCVSKQLFMNNDNDENKPGYYHRKINVFDEDKFSYVDDCQPETTSVYVVFTSPTDHVSRVFRLKEDVDIYSCFSRNDISNDFPSSGTFEISVDESPFMDVNGLYVMFESSEKWIDDIDIITAEPLAGYDREETTIFLFAGDGQRRIDSWQYENNESKSEKGPMIEYSGFTKSARWNGTQIEYVKQDRSEHGSRSLMESQMDEMRAVDHHVTGDLSSVRWKNYEDRFTKPLLEVDPGEDLVAKLEGSLALVCTTMSSNHQIIPVITLNDETKFQEIHCVSKQSYLNEKDLDDKHRGYLKKMLDDSLTSDVVDICERKCEEYAFECDDDEKEQKECETESAECVKACNDNDAYFSDVYIALTNPADKITRVHKLREDVGDVSIQADAPGNAASYDFENSITADSAPFMDTTGIYIQFETKESRYHGCECDCGGESSEETNVPVYLFAGNDYRLVDSWLSISLEVIDNNRKQINEVSGEISVTKAEWSGEEIVYTRYHKKVDPNAE